MFLKKFNNGKIKVSIPLLGIARADKNRWAENAHICDFSACGKPRNGRLFQKLFCNAVKCKQRFSNNNSLKQKEIYQKQPAFSLVEMESVSRVFWVTAAMSRRNGTVRWRRRMEGLLRPDTHRSLLRKPAFSLVEMLMALLVASLLLAALAPVMTKKFNENVVVSGGIGNADLKQKTQEIEFNSDDCSDIKVDGDGSTYCEGTFEVPRKFKGGNIKVTVISAGGGGGVAPTSGYTEYTTAGSTNTFTVPSMTGNIEATLISGGAGGGAGGVNKVLKEFTTVGNNTFTVPEALKNRPAIVDMCGAGGQGGYACGNACWDFKGQYQGAGGGGSGGYYQNKYIKFPGDTSVQVYVGGTRGTPQVFWDSAMYSLTRVDFSKGNGANAEDGSGGAGGGTSNPNVQGRIGGKGGHSAGGEGGAYLGDCGLVGGGGGGGGASRLCTSGQSCYLYVGGGGGGGGEGMRKMNGSSIQATLSGGGGGGGGGTGLGGNGGGSNEMDYGCHSYGGNGGKPGGNGGGQSGCNNANPATSGAGGNSPLSKYPNNCAGGHGEGYNNSFNSRSYSNYWNATNPRPAKNGIVAITYLDYGPGGSGGGAGHIVPMQKAKVNQGESLSIKIGTGGSGGTAGTINSNSTITTPTIGQGSNTNITPMITSISRGSTNILMTPNGAGAGLYGGAPTGQSLGGGIGPFYGAAGWTTNGIPGSFGAIGAAGFGNTNGKTANNTSTVGANTYPNGSIGGDGGVVTTPFTNTCTPGSGGTKTSVNGTNATGYGCGGGGGFAFGRGGNGSGGYARISWNKYWDTASNSYRLAGVGAGGGGASGNVFTFSMNAKAGDMITFRIGKGGSGAYVSNNTLVNSKKGGDTMFGNIKVIGGNGGGSVSINPSYNPSNTINNTNNSPLINGLGGSIPNDKVCVVNSGSGIGSGGIGGSGGVSKDYTSDSKRCIRGNKGNDAVNTTGGKGGDMKAITVEIITYTKNAEGETIANSEKKTISGIGGEGGIQGDNSNGKDANSENKYGSGGGGAAIRDLGQVSSSSQTNITANPSKGGNGSNGKIFLEWWE